MTYVTDVLLCVNAEESSGSSESECVVKVNQWLINQCRGQVRLVSKYSGGRAKPRSLVYMGAFNHLPREELIALIDRIPWKKKNQVQIFWKSQSENWFSEVRFSDFERPRIAGLSLGPNTTP